MTMGNKNRLCEPADKKEGLPYSRLARGASDLLGMKLKGKLMPGLFIRTAVALLRCCKRKCEEG